MALLIFFITVLSFLYFYADAEGKERITDESYLQDEKFYIQETMKRISSACQNRDNVDIDISKYNCSTKTGVVFFSEQIKGQHDIQLDIQYEIKNGQPVTITYINRFHGIKSIKKYDYRSGSFPQVIIEDREGNRFVYDYNKKKVIEVKFPKFQELLKIVKKYNTKDLPMVITEYIQVHKRISDFLHTDWSTPRVLITLLTSEIERKMLARYMMVRNYYNFNRVDNRHLLWLFVFAVVDFVNLGIPFDTKFHTVSFYDNFALKVIIIRDITNKTETIQIETPQTDKVKVTILFDEKGVQVLDCNYIDKIKLQKDIENFNPQIPLYDQIIDYIKEVKT